MSLFSSAPTKQLVQIGPQLPPHNPNMENTASLMVEELVGISDTDRKDLLTQIAEIIKEDPENSTFTPQILLKLRTDIENTNREKKDFRRQKRKDAAKRKKEENRRLAYTNLLQLMEEGNVETFPSFLTSFPPLDIRFITQSPEVQYPFSLLFHALNLYVKTPNPNYIIITQLLVDNGADIFYCDASLHDILYYITEARCSPILEIIINTLTENKNRKNDIVKLFTSQKCPFFYTCKTGWNEGFYLYLKTGYFNKQSNEKEAAKTMKAMKSFYHQCNGVEKENVLGFTQIVKQQFFNNTSSTRSTSLSHDTGTNSSDETDSVDQDNSSESDNVDREERNSVTSNSDPSTPIDSTDSFLYNISRLGKEKVDNEDKFITLTNKERVKPGTKNTTGNDNTTSVKSEEYNTFKTNPKLSPQTSVITNKVKAPLAVRQSRSAAIVQNSLNNGKESILSSPGSGNNLPDTNISPATQYQGHFHTLKLLEKELTDQIQILNQSSLSCPHCSADYQSTIHSIWNTSTFQHSINPFSPLTQQLPSHASLLDLTNDSTPIELGSVNNQSTAAIGRKLPTSSSLYSPNS